MNIEKICFPPNKKERKIIWFKFLNKFYSAAVNFINGALSTDNFPFI